MKIKTTELTGAALDWAVAKCEGFVKVAIWTDHIGICKKYSFEDQVRWAPSTDWAQGGPIIEREGLGVSQYNNIPDRPENRWLCMKYETGMLVGNHKSTFAYGPTPLIAAMRCYVANKLGDEVEVPDGLV
jgi:hypothetical protein